jgi:hypothetical protein
MNNRAATMEKSFARLWRDSIFSTVCWKSCISKHQLRVTFVIFVRPLQM